jgi:hypothetical protein
LSPAHCTWHGPDWQSNSQLEPRAQLQLPSAHVPEQLEWLAQLTWQGGL